MMKSVHVLTLFKVEFKLFIHLHYSSLFCLGMTSWERSVQHKKEKVYIF